jgi:hypothetical protein
MFPFETARLARIIHEERIQQALANRRYDFEVPEPRAERGWALPSLGSLVSSFVAMIRRSRTQQRPA